MQIDGAILIQGIYVGFFFWHYDTGILFWIFLFSFSLIQTWQFMLSPMKKV